LEFHSGREADHSPPSNAEVKEWVELYFHSPNTPSWRGAQLGGAQDTGMCIVSVWLCLLIKFRSNHSLLIANKQFGTVAEFKITFTEKIKADECLLSFSSESVVFPYSLW
jgi:hypothetical protein